MRHGCSDEEEICCDVIENKYLLVRRIANEAGDSDLTK